MKITDKAKNFLMSCNNKRVKLTAIVHKQHKILAVHNCHKEKHWDYSITLTDVKAEINNKMGYIKKYITIRYNYNTSNFAYMKEKDKVEFYARIKIDENDLYIERPSKIKKLSEK